MNKQILNVGIAVLVMVIFAAGATAVANIGVGDHCGEEIITITVTIADNVGSCDVTLKYDPEIVRCAGIGDGDMDVTTPDTKRANEGIIRVVAHQKPDNEGMYGTFVIARISLESNSGHAYAECPLEISVEEFREHTSAAKSMVYSTSDGKYKPECLRQVPGFLGVFAIAIVLAAAYLIERRRRM